MRNTLKIAITSLILGLAIFGRGHSGAQAAEVLVNGSLEASVSPSGWLLTTSITGAPGETIPELFEHNDGSNHPTVLPGELGLFIKPQAGNQGDHAGENLMTNLLLEQTFTGAQVGRIFTFSGHTYWGGDGDAGTKDGYSGGVDLLHSASPSDPTPENPDDPPSVASPTQSTFEIAFLNASNVVLGTPTVLDLRTVQQNNATWLQHSVVSPAAPAGTNKVRVRASLTDMVDNFGFQDVLMDNFSLRDNVATGLERLVNGNLNTPGDPLGWTLTEGPMGADSGAFINFANRLAPDKQGLWLRPFVNTTQFEPDILTVFATMTQTVAATPDADYTFSAWTAWEAGYSGGLTGSGTTTSLKMEFLDGSGTVIGSPLSLELFAAGMSNDDEGNIEPEDWRQFSLPGTAPLGTASVRVSLDAQGMFNSFVNPQSAFFDDFSLITTAEPPGIAGDFNDDGTVDAADYVVWRKNNGTNNALPNDGGLGTPIDQDHYNLWTANFGNTAPGGGSGLGAAAVPEPASIMLLAMALGMIRLRRSKAGLATSR